MVPKREREREREGYFVTSRLWIGQTTYSPASDLLLDLSGFLKSAKHDLLSHGIFIPPCILKVLYWLFEINFSSKILIKNPRTAYTHEGFWIFPPKIFILHTHCLFKPSF